MVAGEQLVKILVKKNVSFKDYYAKLLCTYNTISVKLAYNKA